jgi:hypothetical protein
VDGLTLEVEARGECNNSKKKSTEFSGLDFHDSDTCRNIIRGGTIDTESQQGQSRMTLPVILHRYCSVIREEQQ